MGDCDLDEDTDYPRPKFYMDRRRTYCSRVIQDWIRDNFGLYDDGPDEDARRLRAENDKRQKKALGY